MLLFSPILSSFTNDFVLFSLSSNIRNAVLTTSLTALYFPEEICSLIKFSKTGEPLENWIRIFWLSPDLKACRKNVINAQMIYSFHSSRNKSPWFYPNYIYGDTIHHILEENKNLVKNFLDVNKSII